MIDISAICMCWYKAGLNGVWIEESSVVDLKQYLLGRTHSLPPWVSQVSFSTLLGFAALKDVEVHWIC